MRIVDSGYHDMPLMPLMQESKQATYASVHFRIYEQKEVISKMSVKQSKSGYQKN